MTKAVITGGAGFIGSHLAEYLLGLGQEVWVIDNLSTGRRSNIAPFEGNPRFHFINADVRDSLRMSGLMAQADVAYHLAASVGVKHIMDNLVASIQNNIEGTASVLEAASVDGKKVLVVSTSEVYGKSTEKPSQEDDDLRMGHTIKSRWSYACSKALDEYMAFAYYHERQLPVTVVRLFNTVGDRQTDAYGMVIPTFVRQALQGEPLTIHGDGEQSRCFVYVKDVVKALHQLMEHPGAEGQVHNIGNTEVVTISELAGRIIAQLSSTSKKKFIPYQDAYRAGFEDAHRREPDISKIKALIGFAPQYSLDDIIRLVAEHMREEIRVTAESSPERVSAK